MKPSLRPRAALVYLLLLGFSLGLVMPVALEPDHYLEHTSSAPASAESRVSLHVDDGDHHHETARLEVGEKRYAHCGLCAHLDKSRALVIKRRGAVETLAERSVALADSTSWHSVLGHGPLQPRAPPAV